VEKDLAGAPRGYSLQETQYGDRIFAIKGWKEGGMTIEERLRRNAKKDGTEFLLDDAIETVRYALPASYYDTSTYAAALTLFYEEKKKEFQQYIDS
jgi:hypothetical protein